MFLYDFRSHRLVDQIVLHNVSMTQPSRSNRSLNLVMRGFGKGS